MNTLEKYLKKREKKIVHLLKKNSKMYEPSLFHALRVEIKKVKAIAALAEYSTDDLKSKKALKPYKSLFKEARKIWGIQVEENVFKKYLHKNALTGYRKKLKEQLVNEYFVFIENINDDLFKKLKRSLHKLKQQVAEIKEKDVRSYLDEEKKALEDIMKDILKEKGLKISSLHEFRKQLKRFNYIRNIYRKKENDFQKKKDELSDLLGEWHDQHVVMADLKKVIDKDKRKKGKGKRGNRKLGKGKLGKGKMGKSGKGKTEERNALNKITKEIALKNELIYKRIKNDNFLVENT